MRAYSKDEQEPDIKQLSFDILQNNPDYAGALWFGFDADIADLSLKHNAYK